MAFIRTLSALDEELIFGFVMIGLRADNHCHYKSVLPISLSFYKICKPNGLMFEEPNDQNRLAVRSVRHICQFTCLSLTFPIWRWSQQVANAESTYSYLSSLTICWAMRTVLNVNVAGVISLLPSQNSQLPHTVMKSAVVV